MPILSIAVADGAKQRLGDASNHMPYRAVSVTDVHTGKTRVDRIEPAWASAYWALMDGHEKVLMTDPDQVVEFQAWLDEHARGSVVFEYEIG
jgi:hypothetical protein